MEENTDIIINSKEDNKAKEAHNLKSNFCSMCLFGYFHSKKICSIKEVDEFIISNFNGFIYMNETFKCKFCFSIFKESVVSKIFNDIKEKSANYEHYRLTTGFSPLFTLYYHYLRLKLSENYFTDPDPDQVINNFSKGNVSMVENVDRFKPIEGKNLETDFHSNGVWKLDKDNTFLDTGTIRKMFKPVIVKQIKDQLNKNCIQNSNFEINVLFDFSEKVYKEVFEAFSHLPNVKKLGLKNFKFSMTCKGLDKGHIKDMIRQCNDDLFQALIEKYNLFELMNNELKVTVDAIIDSVYLKGSYLKYSREVGQSPWTINNVKVCATSVQDEIRNYLGGVFDATDVIMHAGGREDRDVRMLGSGRPLMLEIVNPKAMEVVKNIGNIDFVQEIQKKLNNTTELIQLVGLESCEKGYIEVIKKYEDSKIKNYTSVVYASKRLTQKDIDTLNAVKDLEIIQKTPVRVAHRRTLMDRKKLILSLKAQLINEHFMMLDVVSSAGTYIKEFVHSDLGRTNPSVVSLLGCDCDIIQLDVMNIIVDV